MTDHSRVFVIHGRNTRLSDSMYAFLRSLSLKPIEWSQAVAWTRKATPYVGEVLDAGLDRAWAVVVMLSPDDWTQLRPEHAKGSSDPEIQPSGQARPNVLFEAGMAMARYPDRTILVEIGEMRTFSDRAGRYTVRLDNTPQKRKQLAQRLAAAHCNVDTSGELWLTTKAGDFTPPEAKSVTPEPLDARLNIFITGSNSVGKTTVAQALAHQYRFDAIIGTDSIRAGLRPWAEQLNIPEIAVSSFQVSDVLSRVRPRINAERAFLLQCQTFSRGFNAVIEHSRRKRSNAIFEGVNILPTEAFKGVTFHEHSDLLLVVLHLDDEATHRERLLSRIAQMPAVDGDKYVRGFPNIRRIDNFIYKDAEAFARRTGGRRVIIIENGGSVEEALGVVDDRIRELAADPPRGGSKLGAVT